MDVKAYREGREGSESVDEMLEVGLREAWRFVRVCASHLELKAELRSFGL